MEINRATGVKGVGEWRILYFLCGDVATVEDESEWFHKLQHLSYLHFEYVLFLPHLLSTQQEFAL